MTADSTGYLGMLVRVIFRKGVSSELFATRTKEGTATPGSERPGRKVIEENPGLASLLITIDPLFADIVPETIRSLLTGDKAALSGPVGIELSVENDLPPPPPGPDIYCNK